MKYWFLPFTRLTSPQICKISWQERRHIKISSSVKVDGLKTHWESVLHTECKVNREAWPHYEGSQTGRILLYSGICGGWFWLSTWLDWEVTWKLKHISWCLRVSSEEINQAREGQPYPQARSGWMRAKERKSANVTTGLLLHCHWVSRYMVKNILWKCLGVTLIF